MAKTAKAEPTNEMTKEEIVADVRRQLQEGRGKLTNAEVFALLGRIPFPPNIGSSADIIREYSGPLADDSSPDDRS